MNKENYDREKDYHNVVKFLVFYIKEMKDHSIFEMDRNKFIENEYFKTNYYFLCFFNQLFKNYYHVINKAYNSNMVDKDINFFDVVDTYHSGVLNLLNSRTNFYKLMNSDNSEQNYFECLMLPIIGYDLNKKYTIDITMIKYFELFYVGNNSNSDSNSDSNSNKISNIQEYKITFNDIEKFIPYLVSAMNKYLSKNKHDYINSLDNDI